VHALLWWGEREKRKRAAVYKNEGKRSVFIKRVCEKRRVSELVSWRRWWRQNESVSKKMVVDDLVSPFYFSFGKTLVGP
jgi:hypothetical protein